MYFARKYVKIVSLDEGLVPFQPYDFQEKLINNFHEHRFNICKMPRQTGKSTTVVSYLLHYAAFNDSVNIGLLQTKQQPLESCSEDYKLRMRTYPSGCNRVSLHGIKDLWSLENGSKILRFYVCKCCPEVCRSTSSFSTSSRLSQITSLTRSLHLFILLLLLVKAPK